MITKFSTVYPGHIDIPVSDLGQDGTPVNERRFSNEVLATGFAKTEAIAKAMDEQGWDTLWLAEHHFQPEGNEVIPNIPLMAIHLSHLTKRIKIGCGFNVSPIWHPLRLAEDYATADILTKGRTVFGVARGYHTREVEVLGAPLRDQEANRDLFEEQVEIIMKAFHNEKFSHHGKHYDIPPKVPYRGYELEEITLVPRPVYSKECWQPIVSANRRGVDFMVKHDIKGLVGGGAATMAEAPITAYRDANARAGKELELGENLGIGFYFHLADTKEQALREVKPLYEEHVKMFGPLGLMPPGFTEEWNQATSKRGGWAEANVPTVEHYVERGQWFVGTAPELVEHLKDMERRFPGLEQVNLGNVMCTPQAVMMEQFQRVAEEVMPAFKGRTKAGSTREIA